jgi:uncharacterized protein
MTALALKLAGLRREAGVALAPASPGANVEATQPIPRSPVPEQLRKLLGIRARADTAGTVATPVREVDRVLVGDEIAPGLRYVEHWAPWPPAPPVVDLQGIGLERFARHDFLAFDTETTGLAGGTGTRAFMIGASDWRDGGLRTRQLYITTMAAEPAMLREFAAWLNPDTVLVSYNGKSYDRPLLSTRYRLARLDDPVLGRKHVDLLHPVRRRHRGQWENCRLSTVERRLLGVLREDDLPGAEAPRAWLDFIKGGSARNLRRVAQHNHQDLVSLAALLLRFDGGQRREAHTEIFTPPTEESITRRRICHS